MNITDAIALADSNIGNALDDLSDGARDDLALHLDLEGIETTPEEFAALLDAYRKRMDLLLGRIEKIGIFEEED